MIMSYVVVYTLEVHKKILYPTMLV